jgi:hypothetical protein
MDVAQLESMPREELEAEITSLAGHLAAAECRWLLLVAEYDRREGWLQWGCRSCASWLSWKCGLDLRTAQQKLKVAHALSLFPHIRAAYSQGRLSYSKVRALVRCAGPDTEKDLVEMALRATAAHMESISHGYRRVQHEEDRANGNLATRRRVEFTDDFDDPELRVMHAHLTVEECEIIADALARAKADGRSFPDALVAMAESYSANGDACRTGPERVAISVVTDEKALAGDDRGVAHILGGHGLLPETVRRLACDATFRWLLQGPNAALVNVSSQHASVPRSLRRLVRMRDDGHCQFPGCAEGRYTDVHHIVHRADGGPNEAVNLTTLCWFHHRLVHEGRMVDRTPRRFDRAGCDHSRRQPNGRDRIHHRRRRR